MWKDDIAKDELLRRPAMAGVFALAVVYVGIGICSAPYSTSGSSSN